MFVVLRHIELAKPKPGVETLVPAKTALHDSTGGLGNVFGWTDLDSAKAEALKMARAYPGNRYEVFELYLIGSAETPIATWTPKGGA